MTTFSTRLLSWYDQHGRHDLPWQENRTPYRVWLSEIMLQQTQVVTVIDYFLRFTDKFPDVQSLADASGDDVMALWAGLGYYARARNLHRCAQIVCEHYDGEFPESQEALEALPGIGRSTAAAIVAQAFGRRAVILDGNVKRVLSRYACVDGWPGKTSVQKQLWTLADELTPDQRITDYTQAIMDLGATLCVRSRPKCLLCPQQQHCEAHQQGKEDIYPMKKPGKNLPERQVQMCVLTDHDGQILLQKRPPTGIWGGLWSLPEIAEGESIEDFVREKYGYIITSPVSQESYLHTFSHFRLRIYPAIARLQEMAGHNIKEGDCLRWQNCQRLKELGVPRPVADILAQHCGESR